jgi:hypothetical protein
MSSNPLSRTISRPRVSPEAAAAVLGEPVPPAPAPISIQSRQDVVNQEPPAEAEAVESTPYAEIPETQTKKGTKLTVRNTNFDKLTARFEPSGQKTPLNVRVDSSLSKLVTEKVFGAKAKGIPLTKDALVSDALKLYFGIATE